MKHKRLTAGLLAFVLSLSLTLPALAAPSAPLTRGETARTLLAAAEDYNPGIQYSDILKGYADGSLDESGPVTRAQALVMLQRAFGALPAPVGDSARKAYPAASFTDVPSWASAELSNVFQAGIVAGTSAATFSPNSPITEKQLDLFIHRVYALEGTNLKDDFYATVNKEWLDGSTLKPGSPTGGVLYDLMLDSEPLTALIQKAVASPVGEDAQRISALYRNVMNWDARNAAGVTPLRSYLDAVDRAGTLSELMAVQQTVSEELGASLLLGFGLSNDLQDSTRYMVSFSAFSPSLTKDVYAADSGVQKDAYLTYLAALLQLGGRTAGDARADAQRYWALEKAIAPAGLEPQEYGDADKIYNVYTLEQLKALFPQANLDAVYAQSGFTPTDRILVMDPGLLKASAAWFDEAHLDTLKAAARIRLLAGFGGYLSQDFQEAASAYQQAILGVSGAVSDQENATQAVQSLLSDELGRLYVKEYFSPAAKADVTDMVKDFIAVYKARIQKLDWMSDSTKVKALEKLDKMTIKVGYPDDGEWNDFLKGVTLKAPEQGGSYFENIVTILQANNRLNREFQNQPVDKGLWGMSTYTVNAMYNATSNEILFPAGILQAPMYDVNATREENLGGIGYVIAHEITHAFDNNGAKFDADGNAADWWTAADYAAFQEKCAQVTAFYDGVEFAPGLTCDGALTLSENIADLGAAACLMDAAARERDPDYETLFRSMARTWASTSSREYAAYAAGLDVHAPDKLRGSRVLQSLDQFYETFQIQPGDGMWLAPQQRVSVW